MITDILQLEVKKLIRVPIQSNEDAGYDDACLDLLNLIRKVEQGEKEGRGN